MTHVEWSRERWSQSVRRRVAGVREAALARYRDVDLAIVDLDGAWMVRSLNESLHPEPYLVGDSLDSLEEQLGLR